MDFAYTIEHQNDLGARLDTYEGRIEVAPATGIAFNPTLADILASDRNPSGIGGIGTIMAEGDRLVVTRLQKVEA